jgi:antitoxin (DNA-binding transcriptional repressor) of toxin-antitoxin stability system
MPMRKILWNYTDQWLFDGETRDDGLEWRSLMRGIPLARSREALADVVPSRLAAARLADNCQTFAGIIVLVSAVTVRELARNTAAVIREVESSGRPALVTRYGRPVAVDQAALDEWLLARSRDVAEAVGDGGIDFASRQTRSSDLRAQRTSGVRTSAPSASQPSHLRGSHRGD